MRVSCTFVSLAVVLAQQASAAPVIGLPALPLLDGQGRLVNGLSNTLEPVPIVGPLVSDLLESQSRGGLLSTLDLTGKYGLLNRHGLVSELDRTILDRRDLAATVKRGEIPIVGDLLEKIPGVSQLESMLPMDSFSGLNDALHSIPGVDALESLEQDISLPNLSKRDADVQDVVNTILANVPNGKQLQSMIPSDVMASLGKIESLPTISQVQAAIPQVEAMIPQVLAMVPQVEAMYPQVKTIIPQVEAMIPQAMAMVPQVESFVKSLSTPNLSKRDGELQNLVSSILDQVPNGEKIGSMIPLDKIESLVNMSQIQAAIPQVEAMIPQVKALIPQAQAMLPQLMAMVPQAESFLKSVSIPNLAKRDAGVQAMISDILDQVPGGKQIESMIPFDAIPMDKIESLAGSSQIQAMLPQLKAMIPQAQAMLPQVEAMIPQVMAMVPQAESLFKSISIPN